MRESSIRGSEAQKPPQKLWGGGRKHKAWFVFLKNWGEPKGDHGEGEGKEIKR